MKGQRILIIDDEEGMRHALSVILKKAEYEPTAVATAADALKAVEDHVFELVLCDIRMPGMDGMEFLREAKKRGFEAPIIMMSAYGTIDTAVEAMKIGAYDYVSKPFKKDEILLTLKKAEERESLRQENIKLREGIVREYSFKNIISKNDRMQEIFESIRKIADYKTTVIIYGESGTGKELVARAVHFSSGRRNRAFVAVNSGAIPENLLESELFGHVRGAFTDAKFDKAGLIQEADGGTLFLDEIGDLPQPLQVKLLRVLQEEELRRVGDTKPIRVDIRVIAATIRDLEEEVKKGTFREDLFYRLNVFPIKLLPLRERTEDIPILAEYFIGRNNSRMGMDVKQISKEALKILLEYPWPGNVRELENTVERAMVLCETGEIQLHHLPEKIRDYKDNLNIPMETGDLSIKRNSRILEDRMIRKALKITKGNRTKAAKLLDISHRALLYKIQDYGIE